MKIKRIKELLSYCDNEAGNNKECADIYSDIYNLLLVCLKIKEMRKEIRKINDQIDGIDDSAKHDAIYDLGKQLADIEEDILEEAKDL